MWLQLHYQYSMILFIWKFFSVICPSYSWKIYNDKSCNFVFDPNNISDLKENTNKKLIINCSCLTTKSNESNQTGHRKNLSPSRGVITIFINTYNKHVALPSLYSYRPIHPEQMLECPMSQWCSTLKFDFHDYQYFFIHANQVGVTQFEIKIVQQNLSIAVDQRAHNNQKNHNTNKPDSANNGQEEESYFIDILSRNFHIKVLRNHRPFHSVFDYSATFIASLTAFSVGCCTDFTHLKTNLHNPKAVLLSLSCQHFLMPLITIAISESLSLPNQLAYGLCAMSALPGGGLAHLIVVLIHGDRGLSTTISLMNTLLGVLILSLWLLFFGWYFQLTTRIEYVVIWTAPGVFAHAAGFFANKFCPDVAKAVLTWFSRPLLLLSAILLITLGVYINHYAFHYIDYQVVSGLCLVIFGGYCVGGLAGFILFRISQGGVCICQDNATSGGSHLRGLSLRLGVGRSREQREEAITELYTQRMKAMAAENAVFNCLLLIPALRDAMSPPYGDMAATVPLWGIFFTPAPICLYFVVHRVKLCITRFIERRKRKQSHHFSIVTSLAKMAEGMAMSSAPIPNSATSLPTANHHPPNLYRSKSEPPGTSDSLAIPSPNVVSTPHSPVFSKHNKSKRQGPPKPNPKLDNFTTV